MTPQKTNNKSVTTNKRLSVQISLTGLSFLISDVDSKKLQFYSEEKFENSRTPEELLLNLESSFVKHNELQTNFDEVVVIYATNIYSLVPLSLFDASKASEYLKFNSKILANDYIAHDIIENYEVAIVYVPFININNFLFDRFGSYQYFHGCSILLKHVLDTQKHSEGHKAYIHVLEDTFDHIILNNGKLLLCNSYSYKTPEDFIYYILFCFEQLKLNPDTAETLIIGLQSENDPLFKIAYKYIRNVSIYKNEVSPIKPGSDSEQMDKFLLLNSL